MKHRDLFNRSLTTPAVGGFILAALVALRGDGAADAALDSLRQEFSSSCPDRMRDRYVRAPEVNWYMFENETLTLNARGAVAVRLACMIDPYTDHTKGVIRRATPKEISPPKFGHG